MFLVENYTADFLFLILPGPLLLFSMSMCTHPLSADIGRSSFPTISSPSLNQNYSILVSWKFFINKIKYWFLIQCLSCIYKPVPLLPSHAHSSSLYPSAGRRKLHTQSVNIQTIREHIDLADIYPSLYINTYLLKMMFCVWRSKKY